MRKLGHFLFACSLLFAPLSLGCGPGASTTQLGEGTPDPEAMSEEEVLKMDEGSESEEE